MRWLAAAHRREICEIRREDRVYSVSADRHGQRIAAGGRDKFAVIYEIHRGDMSARRSLSGDVVRYTKLGAIARHTFVYSVALTLDGMTCAVGCVDKSIVICNVDLGMSVAHTLQLNGIVQSLSFTPDGSHLATGSDDAVAAVWKLPPEQGSLEQRLVLPRASAVSSVAITNRVFCVAAGTLATVYGCGHGRSPWMVRNFTSRLRLCGYHMFSGLYRRILRALTWCLTC